MQIKGNRFYRNPSGQYIYVRAVRNGFVGEREVQSISIVQPTNLVETDNWNDMELVSIDEVLGILNGETDSEDESCQ